MWNISQHRLSHHISQHSGYINHSVMERDNPTVTLSTANQFCSISFVRVTSEKLLPPPFLFNSPCNLFQTPQEEKYLQTYSITKTTQPTEQQLAIAFLVTACWLKPIISSSAHYIVQLTQLLLLSPALCLYSRASSLLPGPAQIKHTLIGKELFSSYQLNWYLLCESNLLHSSGEMSWFCQGSGQRKYH